MVAFLTALAGRYGAVDETEYAADAFLVGKKGRRQKEWVMVGLEDTRVKQANHSKLTVVSLPETDIDRAEDAAGDLQKAELIRLQDLDLSRNTALSECTEITKIVAAMPRLRELQLNGIKFGTLEIDPAWFGIETLTLNNTGLGWASLRPLAEMPNLRSLHFESNAVDKLESPTFRFERVEVLNLGNNALSDWDFLPVIGAQCPAMQELRVHGNQLVSPETGADAEIMKRLQVLWISDNPRIVGLSVLHWLATVCTQLTSMRVTYATLLPQCTEIQARMTVVSTMPLIASLNNGAVRPKERNDAELFYLQQALRVEEPARNATYPRWPELKEKFKNVVRDDATGTSSGPSLSVVLNLTFRSLGKPFVTKKLLGSMNVGKVKGIIATFWADLPPQNQTLVMYSAGSDIGAAPPQPLDDDLQPLSYYGVGEGAVIEVLERSQAA